MSIDSIVELVIAEIIAFAAFFGYPAFQYISLKRFAKEKGQPQLWYLPDYGFRLVIRNMHHNIYLSDVKYVSGLQKVISPTYGASVASISETNLFNIQEVFFVLPESDMILLEFKLEMVDGEIQFCFIEKTGIEKVAISISNFDYLICDYSANIENYLNFDIRIAKRVVISTRSLIKLWRQTQELNCERQFSIDKVFDIG